MAKEFQQTTVSAPLRPPMRWTPPLMTCTGGLLVLLGGLFVVMLFRFGQ